MPPRLPPWIREKKLNLGSLHEIKSLLRENRLHSVCEELACPNRSECFNRGTATFMILGDVCTRACGFCNVTTGRPYAPPFPAGESSRGAGQVTDFGFAERRLDLGLLRTMGERPECDRVAWAEAARVRATHRSRQTGRPPTRRPPS